MITIDVLPDDVLLAIFDFWVKVPEYQYPQYHSFDPKTQCGKRGRRGISIQYDHMNQYKYHISVRLFGVTRSSTGEVLPVAAVGMKVGRNTGKWEITRAKDEQPELGSSRVEKWTQASESSPASLLVGVTKEVSDSRSRRAWF